MIAKRNQLIFNMNDDGSECNVTIAGMPVTTIEKHDRGGRYFATVLSGAAEFRNDDYVTCDVEADNMAECQQRLVDFLDYVQQGALVIDANFNNIGLTARPYALLQQLWDANDDADFVNAFCAY